MPSPYAPDAPASYLISLQPSLAVAHSDGPPLFPSLAHLEPMNKSPYLARHLSRRSDSPRATADKGLTVANLIIIES